MSIFKRTEPHFALHTQLEIEPNGMLVVRTPGTHNKVYLPQGTYHLTTEQDSDGIYLRIEVLNAAVLPCAELRFYMTDLRMQVL